MSIIILATISTTQKNK
ncbi:TPA: hypothetical protein ACF3MT_004044 [Shigella sonnei]